MNRIARYTTGLVGAMLLYTSCYEDKGNYEYQTVNTVEVVIPETKVRMPKKEAIDVEVKPELSQTMIDNETNLEFQWKRLKKGGDPQFGFIDDYEDISTEKVCRLTIAPNQIESINLLLVVKDKVNGTKWYQRGVVSIIKPLNPCWFVLQEVSGAGQLGVVEGDSKAFYLLPDVMRVEAETGFPISGKPLFVSTRKVYGNEMAIMIGAGAMFGYTANPVLKVVTENNVAELVPSKLTTKYASNKILFDLTQQGKPINITSYKMSAHGEVYTTPDKSYFAHMDGTGVTYSVKGDVSDSNPLVTAYGSGSDFSIFFDARNHRFLTLKALDVMDFFSGAPVNAAYVRMGMPWMDYPVQLRAITAKAGKENVFDPTVGEGVKMLDIVSGNMGRFLYAIAQGTASGGMKVYKFSNRTEDPTCAAVYDMPLPSGVELSAARFASSYAYSANVFFMTAGNKVYRVDLDRGRFVPIYEDANASAVISCIKFKNPELTDEKGMTLGVGVNLPNQSYVVELALTPAGDVNRDANGISIYKDEKAPFSKIVDITFNYE